MLMISMKLSELQCPIPQQTTWLFGKPAAAARMSHCMFGHDWYMNLYVLACATYISCTVWLVMRSTQFKHYCSGLQQCHPRPVMLRANEVSAYDSLPGHAAAQQKQSRPVGPSCGNAMRFSSQSQDVARSLDAFRCLLTTFASCRFSCTFRKPAQAGLCCRIARELARRLSSNLHTQSNAQLALMTSLGSMCTAEGSTHAVWGELASDTVHMLSDGRQPDAGAACLSDLGCQFELHLGSGSLHSSEAEVRQGCLCVVCLCGEMHGALPRQWINCCQAKI